MKRHGVLHPQLAAALAALGHGHQVAVVDCGMPIPESVTTITLALVPGMVPLTAALDAILSEIVVEGSWAAHESDARVMGWLTQRGLSPERVAHEDLKSMLSDARLVVRTGEATAYANVILRCGVAF